MDPVRWTRKERARLRRYLEDIEYIGWPHRASRLDALEYLGNPVPACFAGLDIDLEEPIAHPAPVSECSCYQRWQKQFDPESSGQWRAIVVARYADGDRTTGVIVCASSVSGGDWFRVTLDPHFHVQELYDPVGMIIREAEQHGVSYLVFIRQLLLSFGQQLALAKARRAQEDAAEKAAHAAKQA